MYTCEGTGICNSGGQFNSFHQNKNILIAFFFLQTKHCSVIVDAANTLNNVLPNFDFKSFLSGLKILPPPP